MRNRGEKDDAGRVEEICESFVEQGKLVRILDANWSSNMLGYILPSNIEERVKDGTIKIMFYDKYDLHETKEELLKFYEKVGEKPGHVKQAYTTRKITGGESLLHLLNDS